jgi:hypothetical protein
MIVCIRRPLNECKTIGQALHATFVGRRSILGIFAAAGATLKSVKGVDATDFDEDMCDFVHGQLSENTKDYFSSCDATGTRRYA